MRFAGPITVATCAGILLVGCAPATPEEVGASLATVEDGVLTACVAPTSRLVVEAPDTELGWDGFDVAILEHVADTLALPLALEVVSYDALVSGVALNDGRCDLGAGGIVASEDLRVLLDVSRPYREVDRLVLAKPGSVTASEPSDLAGVRVGHEQGGPAEDALGSLAAAELVPYPSSTDLLRGFAGDDVTAVLVAASDLAAARAAVVDAEIALRVRTGERTVLILAKGADPEVLAAIDEAIAGLEATPTRDALVAEWLER